jgi:hypothetical protein
LLACHSCIIYRARESQDITGAQAKLSLLIGNFSRFSWRHLECSLYRALAAYKLRSLVIHKTYLSHWILLEDMKKGVKLPLPRMDGDSSQLRWSG